MVVVSKKTKGVLVKQVASFEKQWCKNALYSCQGCLEIVGIPLSITHCQKKPHHLRSLDYLLRQLNEVV